MLPSAITTPPTWPAADREVRPWHQTVRGGAKADRTLNEITVSLPPSIASREVPLAGSLDEGGELQFRSVGSKPTESPTRGRDRQIAAGRTTTEPLPCSPVGDHLPWDVGSGNASRSDESGAGGG